MQHNSGCIPLPSIHPGILSHGGEELFLLLVMDLDWCNLSLAAPTGLHHHHPWLLRNWLQCSGDPSLILNVFCFPPHALWRGVQQARSGSCSLVRGTGRKPGKCQVFSINWRDRSPPFLFQGNIGKKLDCWCRCHPFLRVCCSVSVPSKKD